MQQRKRKQKIKPKPQNLILYLLLLANPQGGTKEKSDKSEDHRQLLYQINSIMRINPIS